MFAPKSLIPGQSNFAGMTSATLVERTLGELVYRCHMSIRLCREFHPDEGWGVNDSDDTPGGAWVFYSEIEGHGYRYLDVGERVGFDREGPTSQDGYSWRAIRVRRNRA